MNLRSQQRVVVRLLLIRRRKGIKHSVTSPHARRIKKEKIRNAKISSPIKIKLKLKILNVIEKENKSKEKKRLLK